VEESITKRREGYFGACLQEGVHTGNADVLVGVLAEKLLQAADDRGVRMEGELPHGLGPVCD
jgi:hypothetical protein